MPNWIAITEDTLNEARIAALIEAASTLALGAGQEERGPGIIQGVVDEIRAAVASCASNQLDADLTTIPKGLRDLAVDLIIARLKKAIEQPLTEDESQDLSYRREQLREIAKCELAVDQPDSPGDSETPPGDSARLLSTPNDNPFEQLGTN